MTTVFLAQGAFDSGSFEPTAFFDYIPVPGMVAGQGALALGVSVSLAGLAMTAAGGVLTPVNAKSITGQVATSGQGSVGKTVSPALAGQSMTAGGGVITPTVASTLLGQAMAAAQGAVTTTVAKAISGQAMAAAQGALDLVLALRLLGQAMVTYAGNLFVHYDPGAEQEVPVPSELALIVISGEPGANVYIPPEQNMLYIQPGPDDIETGKS